jgi:uncharacterized damage-inducible protein DinB
VARRTLRPFEARAAVIASWRTNARVTAYLIERLPLPLWTAPMPGSPQRSVRTVAAHLHNARCRWIRTLGQEHGLKVPVFVDRRTVTPGRLLAALDRSSRGIESLLELGCARGGQLPGSKAYVWRNLPLDVEHVLTYFVAHEAHHRGQIVMLARQLGHRLTNQIAGGLWQWTTRARETRRVR